MKYSTLKLNRKQLDELGKTFLDMGKVIFLSSVAAYFIPSLVNIQVTLGVLIAGSMGSLTFIIWGLILLRDKENL